MYCVWNYRENCGVTIFEVFSSTWNKSVDVGVGESPLRGMGQEDFS